MRSVTVAEALSDHVPKGCTHKCRRYKLQPGTAWKMDVYGKHEVVKIDEATAKKAEYTYCTAHFDGREMAIFDVGGTEHRQPTEENDKATDNRLGSKRKIRKLKKQRKEAPGVAKAISWENDGAEPKEDPKERALSRRSKLHDEQPEGKSYRRAGPRKALVLY
jgi:hypothetical protein